MRINADIFTMKIAELLKPKTMFHWSGELMMDAATCDKLVEAAQLMADALVIIGKPIPNEEFGTSNFKIKARKGLQSAEAILRGET